MKKFIGIVLACVFFFCSVCTPVFADFGDYTEEDLLSKTGTALKNWICLLTPLGSVVGFCEACVSTADLLVSNWNWCIEQGGQRLSQEECLYYWDGLAHELEMNDVYVFQDAWTLWLEIHSTADTIGFMQAESVAVGLTLTDICSYIYNDDGTFKTDGTDLYINENNEVVLSKEALLAIANRMNSYYIPTLNSDTITISQLNPIYDNYAHNVRKPLRFGSDMLGGQNWSEAYYLGFSKDSDAGVFFASYQIRIYHETSEDGTLNLMGDFIFLYDESLNCTKVLLSNLESFPYVAIMQHYKDCSEDLSFNGFPTLPAFINLDFTSCNGNTLVADGTTFPIHIFYNNQSLSTQTGTTLRGWVTKDNGFDDFGFYLSQTPFEIDIDPIIDIIENLDPAAQIIPAGQSIYDYSITYGNTTTTIYNIYHGIDPDEPSTDVPTDTPTTGGTVSGDINVSGEVGVSGNIDINVNVNQTEPSLPAWAETGEVYFDEDIALDDYYDWMTEQSSGFGEFMGAFFSWLPPDILMLLGSGVACIILMRVLGR